MFGSLQSNLCKAMGEELNYTRTENGALTHKSTKSAVLDMFAMGGAMRNRSDEDIIDMYENARLEDHQLANRCLMYLRDIRSGVGERRFFRVVMGHLAKTNVGLWYILAKHTLKYGRWDDIIYTANYSNESWLYFMHELSQTMSLPSDLNKLLFKWLPSINTSSKTTRKLAKRIAKSLNMTHKEYRKMLSRNRSNANVVEHNMSTGKWNDINYSHVPSKAMLNYNKAFEKRDPERFKEYMESVKKGEAKINTGTLFPYEVMKKAHQENADVIWNNLPDYTNGRNGIVVADVSLSMTWEQNGLAMDVAVSLAIYYAERNRGLFKGNFITFSDEPSLISLPFNCSLKDKVEYVKRQYVSNGTNINAVFELILQTALKYNMVQADLPETIYIISDMEFDEAEHGRTNFEVIKRAFSQHKFEMPHLVFWNVNSRQNNVAVKKDEPNVTLVSGCSASIFKHVTARLTPYEYMLSVLNSERYADIKL